MIDLCYKIYNNLNFEYDKLIFCNIYRFKKDLQQIEEDCLNNQEKAAVYDVLNPRYIPNAISIWEEGNFVRTTVQIRIALENFAALSFTLLESQDQIWDEKDHFWSKRGIKIWAYPFWIKVTQKQDQKAWSEMGSNISVKWYWNGSK